MTTPSHKSDALAGCLLGTAVGDALGLPYEGLKPDRAARMLGPPDRYRLLARNGMVSDDTEHACMTAQSLIDSAGDIPRFRRALAWRLRWWVAAIPAGVGFATLRACGKLWLGVSSARSGVWSAGNGPAMRSPILGVALGADHPELMAWVETSTKITHRDPKALHGAYTAALAAAWAAEERDPERFVKELTARLCDYEEAGPLIERVNAAWHNAATGGSTSGYAHDSGLQHGVTGYVYDTVPVALHAWFRHPDNFQQAVTGVIECGGDADSTGALAGAIVGAGVGTRAIPERLLTGIVEWPRTVAWMRNLGETLAASESNTKAPKLNPAAILIRNVFFVAIVLGHGFRRLAPPY